MREGDQLAGHHKGQNRCPKVNKGMFIADIYMVFTVLWALI